MIQKLQLSIFALFMSLGLLVSTPAVSSAAPVNVLNQCESQSQVCRGTSGNSVFNIIKGIINLLITISGIISVIMIIVGGIKYSTSGGDSSAISSGRDTLVYAVIGLVVSIMAFAIVNFLLSEL